MYPNTILNHDKDKDVSNTSPCNFKYVHHIQQCLIINSNITTNDKVDKRN